MCSFVFHYLLASHDGRMCSLAHRWRCCRCREIRVQDISPDLLWLVSRCLPASSPAQTPTQLNPSSLPRGRSWNRHRICRGHPGGVLRSSVRCFVLHFLLLQLLYCWKYFPRFLAATKQLCKPTFLSVSLCVCVCVCMCVLRENVPKKYFSDRGSIFLTLFQTEAQYS